MEWSIPPTGGDAELTHEMSILLSDDGGLNVLPA